MAWLSDKLQDTFQKEPQTAICTLVGEESVFSGTLSCPKSIRIDGKFEEAIDCQGDVIVGEKGVIKATISARKIQIMGEVHGPLNAQQSIEIGKTGQVIGDILCPQLFVEEGASYLGKVNTKTIHQNTRYESDGQLAKS